MIPRRGQGVSGEVSSLLDQFVEGSLQVVDLLPLFPCFPSFELGFVAIDGFQGGDQLGVNAPAQVLRRDSPPSPDGSVEVGSAIAVDERHVP